MKNWTGERLETFVMNESTIEHLHRYALASEWVSGKIVLDIACGEGYGTALLAQNAQQVYGVDIDDNTIVEAQKKYKGKNISFQTGSVLNIPLDENTVDVVVSFETLEHLEEHHQMLTEIKRVLRTDGLLIISTPDKKIYSDERNYDNPYHIKELYAKEFKEFIQSFFTSTHFFLQNMHWGSTLISEKPNSSEVVHYHGHFNQIQKKSIKEGMYLIAIASDQPIGIPKMHSYFDGEKIIRDTFERNMKLNIRYKIGTWVMAPYLLFKKIFR